jgi:signal-transduction protein with cAMP-binding, CBS, and nucleotidyltransferase domain
MACRISALKYHPIETLEEHIDVHEAVAFMAEREMESVLVTNKGRVAGLFTEQDLVRRVIGLDKDPKTVTLGSVCSHKLISVHEDASCENAIKTMRSNQCQRLLVYRGETLKGLVSMPAIAVAIANNTTKSNALLNVVGGTTLLVTLAVIGLGLYQLPEMVRLAMAVME